LVIVFYKGDSSFQEKMVRGFYERTPVKRKRH
jgi:hypothetical protein